MSTDGLAGAPLKGFSVLDLSDTLAGAQASLFLADLGAEVMMVERADSALRRQPGFPVLARGKQSIVLDLKDDADRDVAVALAERCDVLIETFRPGVADRLGLGYDTVARVNPRVVYCSVTGFGTEGPCADLKGYEALVMAKVGALGAIAPMVARPGPAFSAVPFASLAASQLAIHAVLTALYEREGSGAGQRVETSLLKGIAALDPGYWFLYLMSQRFPDAFVSVPAITDDGEPTNDIALRGLVALTADGHWLQFSQVMPHMFEPFMRELGLAWMFDDPEWSGVPRFEDHARRVECWDRMLAAARQKTLADWQAVMDGNPNIWAEQFRTGREVLDHPQLLHNKQVVEIFDPDLGPVRQPDRMISFKEGMVLGRAPRAGEHDRGIRRRAAEGTAADAGDGSAVAGRLPLEGVTVLELGAFFAGPYGATILTDLGARVIKIEPLTGDPMRGLFPIPETAAMKVLQGKESVAVDMGTDEGRAIVHELARRSDVVLQSFRANVARRLGLDAETLRGLNPELVYLNAPGYGMDGPCCDRPAFGMTIGAATIARRNLGPSVDSRPDLTPEEVKAQSMRLWCAASVGIANCDGLSGLAVASALLAGLVAHRRGVPGPEMLTTMLGNAAHIISDDAVDYAARPEGPAVDAELLGFGALYRLYETAEGWVFLAAPQEREWAPLAAALSGSVELADDARFATPDDRAANDDALAALLADVFRTEPAREWERRLRAVDVGCVVAEPGPAEAILMSNGFGRASGLVTDVVHPLFEEVPRLAPLVSFSRSATRAEPGCTVGQHTAAILTELGYSADQIDQLVAAQVVDTGA